MVKIGCNHLGHRAFKLALSHKGVNGINELIIIGWAWPKVSVAPLKSWDSKNCYIGRKNGSIELIFSMLMQIQES